MKSPFPIYTVIIAVSMTLSITACENKRSGQKNGSKETTTVNKGAQIDKVTEGTKKKSSQNKENADEEVQY